MSLGPLIQLGAVGVEDKDLLVDPTTPFKSALSGTPSSSKPSIKCAIICRVLARAIVFVGVVFVLFYLMTRWAHYIEQVLRLIAGGAIVIFAPSMWYPDLFNFFGWLIVVTAVGLLLIPWRWHHEFGKWAIPLVIRHMNLYALGASALAILVFYGLSRAVLS